jgi:hypothetical protein
MAALVDHCGVGVWGGTLPVEHVHIVMLHKGGQHIMANYCGISLLDVCDKVYTVLALQGEVVEWVSKFKYLGTLVSSSGDILAKVKAIGTFALLKPILLNKGISLGTQMLFYMTLALCSGVSDGP